MNGRRLLVAAIGGITLVASGGYLFIYLYRWEWNRAIISGVIFLAAEIAIVGWALNRKLSDVQRSTDVVRSQRIGRQLAAVPPERSAAFDWLKPTQRTSVFVPILMGAGLLLSGIAWIVERVARATAGRVSDQRLATSLSSLAPPRGGFLDDSNDVLRDLRAPSGGRW